MREKFAYSVNEAIKILGLGRTTLYKLIASGLLKTVKIGGRRLIPRAAIEALLQS